MATHNFALLKQCDIDACIERAHDAVRSWESAWCSSSGIEVTCGEAYDPSVLQASGQWTAHRHAQGAIVWCYRPTDFSKQVERLIFDLNDSLRNTDRNRESAIANSVTTEATNELVELMVNVTGTTTALAEPEAQPADWQFRRNSGAALIQITSGGKALYILIPAERLPSRENRTKLPKKDAVTPLPAALTKIELRLIAELGQVEMSLGHFASLEIGDVINLPIGIDQTLTVYTEDRRPVAVAYLGQQDGHRALEIFKTPHK